MLKGSHASSRSYTQADNSVVVATDSGTCVDGLLCTSMMLIGFYPNTSVKNITYCDLCPPFRRDFHLSNAENPLDMAKTSPHILHPERFALHLGTFLVSKYAHIHKAFVTIEKLRWQRIAVKEGEEAKEHPYSFFRDGDDKTITSVEVSFSMP